MIVDLVLAGDGSYWRKRVEMSDTPSPGQRLVLVAAPEVVGVVVGTATPFDDDGSEASVLLRAAPTGSPAISRDGLRREGWLSLL